MYSLGELHLAPVWVNRDHRVMAARLLMDGYKLPAVGVLDGERLMGVVFAGHAETADPDALVESIMRPVRTTMPCTTLVNRAAQIFIDEDLDVAVVMDEGKFRGLVTSRLLLKELRRSWDPLTNLGWSDRLREWGVDNLRAGQEITILFADIDKFGEYNKLYGHVVGDNVLRRVAAFLKAPIDRQHDILVRFGGDEFAIGTTRTREDAERLMSELLAGQFELFIHDAHRPVTFSIGIAGGRRTKEREATHFAATVDDVINLASKDCLARKLARDKEISQAGGGGPDRPFRAEV